MKSVVSLVATGLLFVFAPPAAGQRTDTAALSLVADGAKVERLATGMAFTEGPVWVPARKILVFSDIPNSRWMQWSETDGLQEFGKSAQANGNLLDLKGRLISCQHAARNLIRLEDDDVTVIADQFEGRRFNSPNDAAIRSDGSLWFTDPPWGLTGEPELPGHWVFRIDKDGRVQPVIEDLAMPNGICFSPDESRLYIADTGGNSRHPDPAFHDAPACIRCYAITAEGELGKLLFTIDQGSDGMTVDVQGNIYTTHGNQVMIYDAYGKRVEAIEVPEAPANVCFGGDDYRTLFITARTSLYRVPMRVAGARPEGAKW